MDQDSIYQHLPDYEGGFHAGDGAGDGNRKSIGIEMCVNAGNDYEATLQNTAKLVQTLMKQYSIQISKVVQHNHWTGKNCPKKLRAAGRWDEFLRMVSGEGEEVKSTYIAKSGMHIVKIPVSRFRIGFWDKNKRTTAIANYANAGFFGNFYEGKQLFTLPAGNLMADILPGAAVLESQKKTMLERGTIENGVLTQDGRASGKSLTTFMVVGSTAKIGVCKALPTGCKYALSGIPVMRDGKDVSWKNDVLSEGWDASSCYATWHGFLCVTASGGIVYAGMKTTAGNCIQSSEAYKKLTGLGLGITDAIKLDGGGSYILDVGGTNKAVTSGRASE